MDEPQHSYATLTKCGLWGWQPVGAGRFSLWWGQWAEAAGGPCASYAHEVATVLHTFEEHAEEKMPTVRHTQDISPVALGALGANLLVCAVCLHLLLWCVCECE